MGFWHTGYMEFHEPVGLGEAFEPPPQRFPCSQCGEVFSTLEEMRTHRFAAHPIHRPVMFLRGRELGTHPVQITSRIVPNDISIELCDTAVLNGVKVTLPELPMILARKTNEFCKVILTNSRVNTEFTLDFRVASEADLLGIESQFSRIAKTPRLDTFVIEEFISAASVYKTVIGYCDGICSYLYGVLAKERAHDSNLSYDEYLGKFNKAQDDLAVYDRPLARTIGSLIEFHFNHFADAARLSPLSRVGCVAGRYADWIDPTGKVGGMPPAVNTPFYHLEALVTDWETEKLIRWGICQLDKLILNVEEMESCLGGSQVEFDRVKLRILLAETYASSGNAERALTHAKALRNLGGFEKWAERLIRTLGVHR